LRDSAARIGYADAVRNIVYFFWFDQPGRLVCQALR
jgi:hypothetical protein